MHLLAKFCFLNQYKSDKMFSEESVQFIDLKKENATVDYALALVEIAIEGGKLEGQTVIKVLHGYGSHGRGGVILIELRKQLERWKRSKFIKDYFGGDRWNIFDPLTMEILQKDKTIYGDEDMGRANPGITIIYIQ